MDDLIWTCERQRAGPLVKECRAIRPRLSADDNMEVRIEKNAILMPKGDCSICRTRIDRLELRLALFGWDGIHYTLTFDPEHLPEKYRDVHRAWRAFLARARRWRETDAIDYILVIEGKHGDKRLHVHSVLRDSQLPPAVVRHLWKYGDDVDDEPLLIGKHDNFRRLARYFNKEIADGVVIPVGTRRWVCSRSLSAQLPPPERWRDSSGVIHIPDGVYSSGRSDTQNEFGSYYYGWYIEPKTGLYLNQ